MSAVTPRMIVLIGAARSGTKVLRDSLAAATGAGAVPFDIGFVWGIGQEVDNDVFDAASVSPRRKRFIRRYIQRRAAGSPPAVIEKTVGNTLRVPFVASVLPDAMFVHLIRNGVDVVESTFRQWHEPAEVNYLLSKARHFPIRMLPSYGRRHASSLLRRRVARDRRVSSWGPRYPGIDDDLQTTDLLTVCARQWRTSVTHALSDLPQTGQPVHDVRYEDLVQRPVEVLTGLADFCGLETDARALAAAASGINASRSGVGFRSLTERQRTTLVGEIGPLLAELGYPDPGAQGDVGVSRHDH